MFKKFQQHFQQHFAEQQALTLTDFFKAEPKRYSNYQVSAAGLTLDFCRQPVTATTLKLFQQFAEQVHLKDLVQAMFNGEKINTTEERAVLHVALRGGADKDFGAKIKHEQDKMQKVVENLHQKTWLGASGKAITDVVNLGIGGSDLGPRMVTSALKPYHYPDLKVHFVANVDGSDIYQTLKHLNPETTLFIIASKSFTTQETLLNAATAKTWLSKHIKGDLSQHFIGITAKPDKAITWGINPDYLFEMWDVIGGRYSLWSSIGLPIAIQLGMKNYQDVLAGAHLLDQHFNAAPASENLPMLLALFSIMNQNFYGAESHAVLPYNQYLELFPAYLQQTDMESNGKSTDKAGNPISYQTGVVLWGGAETNGQHSFHQLLHQGTLRIPVDFILAFQAEHPYPEHQQALIANCFAQAQALCHGNSEQNPPAFKLVPGNKPSNLILMEQLNPQSLGALIALYEHKVFTQSLIWDINAFDQWGVELGKQLAVPLLKKIESMPDLSIKNFTKLF